MKTKIEVYKIQKVLDKDFEVDLPDKPCYFFETGIRRAIRIIPIWSTWKKQKGEEEIIWQYHITCVYRSFENKIESFTVSATSGLSDIYQSDKSHPLKSFMDGWLDNRTEQQFMTDLQSAINNLNDFELI